MRLARLILTASLLVTLLVLVVQNIGLVGLRFITWELALPIAVPVVGAYLLGAWTGRPFFRFLNRERKSLRNDIPSAEALLAAEHR